jgi:hypothetical protein
MTKVLTYEQADDIKKEAPENTRRDQENCEMIIRLYFAEFLPAWEDLKKRVDELLLIYAEFTHAHHTGEDTARFAKLYEGTYREFQKRDKVLENALVTKARKFTPTERRRLNWPR